MKIVTACTSSKGDFLMTLMEISILVLSPNKTRKRMYNRCIHIMP